MAKKTQGLLTTKDGAKVRLTSITFSTIVQPHAAEDGINYQFPEDEKDGIVNSFDDFPKITIGMALNRIEIDIKKAVIPKEGEVLEVNVNDRLDRYDDNMFQYTHVAHHKEDWEETEEDTKREMEQWFLVHYEFEIVEEPTNK